MGAKTVVIKGGHLIDGAVDVLYDGRDFYEFPFTRIQTKDTHGTGCTYSAALTTGLAMNRSILESVELAQQYIAAAIRHALRLGSGHGPTNHLAPLLQRG
jgi:hydroxymethylpyrimidine/phosphomethylpyrimidine kinase